MAERVELELNLKGGDKAVKTLGQLEKELDDARQAIKEVEVGSDAFNKLATKIQKASSEVKTLEKQMEGLEPQQKAEAFLKMGEGIAGGFAVAQGALALAGMESEQLEKIQVKVQAAISIAMGVRMMSEAALMATTAKRVIVEKLAIAQSKVGLVITKASAAATLVAATAQKVFTGAIKLTTVGLKLLKLAIIATGIGALVVAITAIGVAVYKWATATSDVTKQQANLNRELAKQNEEFIKNRKLQQEVSAANTEAEKKLVKLRSELNDNINALSENSEKLNKNAEDLENLSDFSKDSQKIIQKNTITLQNNTTTLQNNINTLDERIAAVKEEIAAEKQKEQEEKERANRRKQRSAERRQQRKKEAEQLRSLEQEIALLRIEDEDERAAAKIEQDRQIALKQVENAKNAREQILLINEKYDALELERLQTQLDKEQEAFDQYFQEHADRVAQQQQEESDRIKADREKAVEEEKERQQKIADFKSGLGEQGFELAKKLGGKNEKIQKKLAIAETAFLTGKSIMRALADIPAPFGIAQAAIHGAMGIAQIASIRNETIGGVNGTETDVQEMIPASTGAFELGNIQQEPVKAFVVESEITDSQAQMADINRRSTI